MQLQLHPQTLIQFTHAHVHAHIPFRAGPLVYGHIQTRLQTGNPMCFCMHACMHVGMYARMYVRTYVCTYARM